MEWSDPVLLFASLREREAKGETIGKKVMAMRGKLSYSNVVASCALFLALSGVAVAAGLPKAVVGTPQLKKEAVTTGKIAKGAVTPSRLSQGVFDALGDSGKGLSAAAAREAVADEEAAAIAAADGTQEGMFSVAGGDREVVSFPTPLAAKPSSYHVLNKGASSPECPGVGADAEHPQATAGNLCLYIRDAGSIEWDAQALKAGVTPTSYCGGGYELGPNEGRVALPFLHVDGTGYGAVPPNKGGDGQGEVRWWEDVYQRFGWTKANYCEKAFEHHDAIPGTYDPATQTMQESTRTGLTRFGFDLRLDGEGTGHGMFGVWAVGS